MGVGSVRCLSVHPWSLIVVTIVSDNKVNNLLRCTTGQHTLAIAISIVPYVNVVSINTHATFQLSCRFCCDTILLTMSSGEGQCRTHYGAHEVWRRVCQFSVSWGRTTVNRWLTLVLQSNKVQLGRPIRRVINQHSAKRPNLLHNKVLCLLCRPLVCDVQQLLQGQLQSVDIARQRHLRHVHVGLHGW